MDSPERGQIGTPISKFEESPFSNFVNSLSPIKPTKTMHISQTFSSLSFSSPPSVFTSPHLIPQKESRVLRRHQVSEVTQCQISSDDRDENGATEDGNSPFLKPESSTTDGDRGAGPSIREGCVSETLKSAIELPRELKFDSGSPECMVAGSSGTNAVTQPEGSVSLQSVDRTSRMGSSGFVLNSQDMEQNNDETASDWENLISVASDLSVVKSSKVDAAQTQNAYHPGSVSCDESLEPQNQSAQPSEANEGKEISHAQEIPAGSSMDENVVQEVCYESDDVGLYNLHRGFRRRCLVYEIAGVRKNLVGNSPQYMPGIGLHLNALAPGLKDRVSSERQHTSPPGSSDADHSVTAIQDLHVQLSTSTFLSKEISPSETGALVGEDASQASAHVASEEINLNSPKKKKRKFENTGEAEACKRCNCKKSKCLKLYCECFAAGVYCVEPCSCQDCFNKPIHEDTVLTTRRQIESRNPLAFAPKVIKASDPSQDLGDDSTRTPASARHKRGCNCKKSNCLKKYCECYQGGVGCSVNCRCEGCKNAFGRKDGPTLLGMEVEAEGAQKSMANKESAPPEIDNNDEENNSEFTIPRTPLRLFRSSLPLPTSSKEKPPRSFVTSSLHLLEGTGRSTFLRSQPKIDKHFEATSLDETPEILQPSSPPSTGIKTLSPNGKRISPPHHENRRSPGRTSTRKLILQSIPSFPSLTPRH